jgi:hypothetical protein
MPHVIFKVYPIKGLEATRADRVGLAFARLARHQLTLHVTHRKPSSPTKMGNTTKKLANILEHPTPALPNDITHVN